MLKVAKHKTKHSDDCRKRMERILEGTERSERLKRKELEYFKEAFDREECKRRKRADADRGPNIVQVQPQRRQPPQKHVDETCIRAQTRATT